LSDQQKEFLETLPKSCQDVLEKLRETLDKYSLVVSDGRNAKSSIQRVWNRITWDPKEARYFHEKIVSEIAYFNLFLAQSALYVFDFIVPYFPALMNISQVVRETRSMVALSMDKVNKLVEADDDNKRLSMLDWLSSRNPEAKHAGILNRRQAETGQWFLETEKFQQWLAHDCHVSKDQSTLFCHGYEGAGKTFISAIVVEHLRQRLGSDDAVRIAFFYCDFSEQPTVSNILASLLRQLLQGNTSQLSSLKALYDALEKKQRHPTEDEILGLLDTAISCHS
jgi:hypothetical protein